MNLTCTTCAEVVTPDRQAIVGVRIAGRLHFGFACCHKPVAAPEIVLASVDCAQQWCVKHPEYIEDITALIASADEHQRGHKPPAP